MKKGFTIIELIVTIVIIAIIGGIGVVAYNNIFDASSKNYYQTVEQSLLLSGSEYFEKNRDELPIKGYNVVTLDNLEDDNYISPVKDKKGGTCESGEVYVTRNPNTRQYEYEVCLKCLDYESEGAFCKGYVPGSINVNAYLEKDNNHKYNPLLSYKNVEVTKDNVILELYLDDSNLSYYSIDKVNNHCIATNQKCNVKIENSGSYLVSAYSADGVKIADDRIINVKIDKEAPTFDIINDKRYVITDGTNKKDITIKLDNVKDDMGIKKVSYCIKLENETCEENDFKNLTDNTYLISENLVSGSYHIEVKVEDVAGNVTTKSSSFDVSYYVTLEYEDGKTSNFEVIKGKKYGYLENLPNNYNNIIIAWVYKGTMNEIYDDTTVTEGQTHVLTTIPTTKISVPSSSSCQTNLVYNGKNQKLTQTEPYGVLFYNNTGTNAGNYTVKAKLLEGLVWSDGTTTDKDFTCSIAKATPVISVTENTKTFTYGTTNSFGVYSFTIGGSVNVSSTNSTSVAVWTSSSTIEVTNDWTTHHNEFVVYLGGEHVGTSDIVINFTPQDTTNYHSVSKTVPCTITKATPVFSITENTKTFNYGTTAMFGAYSHTVNGSVSVSSNKTSIVTASASSSTINVTNGTNHHNEVVISLTAKGAGTAVVTVTFTPNDTTNYNSVSKTANITINKVAATLSCSNKTYTGSSITGCTCTGGTCKNCKKTAVGTYTASCTPDDNHTAPSNKSWQIKSSSPTCAEYGMSCNGTLNGHAGWGVPCSGCGTACAGMCSGQSTSQTCCRYE